MADTMTLIEKTVFLSTVEVLKGVPSDALAQLAGRATEVFCERGRTLFQEGQEDQGIFIVVEGQLELRKAATVIRHLREGAAHGELFLAENQPHQYSAVALEKSHLLNLTRSDVVEALLEYPEFGVAMTQDLSLRLHKLTERVIELEAELKRQGARPLAVDGEALEPPGPDRDAPKQRRWWRRPKPGTRSTESTPTPRERRAT
jgi:CRP-like cAMP-binding protein